MILFILTVIAFSGLFVSVVCGMILPPIFFIFYPEVLGFSLMIATIGISLFVIIGCTLAMLDAIFGFSNKDSNYIGD